MRSTPINTDMCYCCPQGNDLVNITECDLRVTVGPFRSGPGRLATQLLTPLTGFEAIQGLQPFLSLSTRISSSEVFLVDDLLVVFTGFSNGQVRKVRIELCTIWGYAPFVRRVRVVRIYIYIYVVYLRFRVCLLSFFCFTYTFVFPSMPPGASLT